MAARSLVSMIVAGAAGCGAASQPRVADAKPAGAAARARAPIPAALAPHADTTIPQRARVARAGAVRLEATAPALDLSDLPGTSIDPDAALLVAAERGDQVQLRVDGDDASLLVWVARADLVPVVVRSQALAQGDGVARAAVARPGAAVQVVGTRGAEREVVVDDGEVSARGRVPAAALGTVYPARAPRADVHDGVLDANVDVRAQPAPDAAVVATTRAVVAAHQLAPARDGWIEVELDRPQLYVRGFAPVAAFTGAGDLALSATGAGAFGMSDTATLILPAGACLYARPGGPVIGVNRAEKERYASDADGAGDGWRQVAVTTPWGLAWPAVHFPAKAGAPTGDFDRCDR